MEKVDKSWPATLKQIFVIIKSAVIICITLHAAYKWRKSKHPMGKAAQFCLFFNALIVLGVCIYKFTSKQIAPLFLLQAASHYSAFLVFHVLIAYAPVNSSNSAKEMKRKILTALKPFHAMFIVIIYVGFKACHCD